MKQATFLEGVALALAASLAGGILFSALTPLFASGPLLRVLIAALGLVYVLYLLRRSRERQGRILVVVTWCIAAVVFWWLHPPLFWYLMMHLGLIWLIRSLYFYNSVLSSLADLMLNGLALAASIWASRHTGSLLLSLWCFFLVQALFVAIPHSLRHPWSARRTVPDNEDRFQQAHRAAQAALRKLSSLQ